MLLFSRGKKALTQWSFSPFALSLDRNRISLSLSVDVLLFLESESSQSRWRLSPVLLFIFSFEPIRQNICILTRWWISSADQCTREVRCLRTSEWPSSIIITVVHVKGKRNDGARSDLYPFFPLCLSLSLWTYQWKNEESNCTRGETRDECSTSGIHFSTAQREEPKRARERKRKNDEQIYQQTSLRCIL